MERSERAFTLKELKEFYNHPLSNVIFNRISWSEILEILNNDNRIKTKTLGDDMVSPGRMPFGVWPYDMGSNAKVYFLKEEQLKEWSREANKDRLLRIAKKISGPIYSQIIKLFPYHNEEIAQGNITRKIKGRSKTTIQNYIKDLLDNKIIQVAINPNTGQRKPFCYKLTETGRKVLLCLTGRDDLKKIKDLKRIAGHLKNLEHLKSL